MNPSRDPRDGMPRVLTDEGGTQLQQTHRGAEAEAGGTKLWPKRIASREQYIGRYASDHVHRAAAIRENQLIQKVGTYSAAFSNDRQMLLIL